MYDKLILTITAIFIPLLVILSIYLYKYKNISKLNKVFAITLLSLELTRFFYNASLYEKAITPSTDLKFSYISILNIFILIALFNKSKVGKFFNKVVIYTSFIPLIYGLINNNIYLNQLDKYYVMNAIYYIEVGFILTISLLMIFINKDRLNIKKELFNILYSSLIWTLYIGIMIPTRILFKIKLEYNLMFYLSIFLPYLTLLLNLLIIYLFDKYYLSKRVNEVKINKFNRRRYF